MKEKTKVEEKMDVVSTKTMVQEINISTNSARIINQYLWQHFGWSLFASKAEHMKYFARSDFPPTMLTKVLEDYTIIPFWFKRPHGGKLNGVDCQELIHLSKPIFAPFQSYLLAVEHPNRWSANEIIKHCSIHTNICATLDTISSNICMKFHEPEEEDYVILEKALQNLVFLRKDAGLSYTPKVHSVLVHVLEHMREFQGIGDMLEDDVEHIHQLVAKIEARTSRMKDKARQAFVH